MRALFIKIFWREMNLKNILTIIGLCLFLAVGIGSVGENFYYQEPGNLSVLYYQCFFIIFLLNLAFVYENFKDQKVYKLLYSLPVKRRELVNGSYFFLLFNLLVSIVTSYFFIVIFGGLITGSFNLFTDLNFLLYLIPYILVGAALITHGHINMWGRWVDGLSGGFIGFSIGFIEALYRGDATGFQTWSVGQYLNYLLIRILIIGAIYLYSRYRLENKDIY